MLKSAKCPVCRLGIQVWAGARCGLLPSAGPGAGNGRAPRCAQTGHPAARTPPTRCRRHSPPWPPAGAVPAGRPLATAARHRLWRPLPYRWPPCDAAALVGRCDAARAAAAAPPLVMQRLVGGGQGREHSSRGHGAGTAEEGPLTARRARCLAQQRRAAVQPQRGRQPGRGRRVRSGAARRHAHRTAAAQPHRAPRRSPAVRRSGPATARASRPLSMGYRKRRERDAISDPDGHQGSVSWPREGGARPRRRPGMLKARCTCNQPARLGRARRRAATGPRRRPVNVQSNAIAARRCIA
jgi:hypothetical protein